MFERILDKIPENYKRQPGKVSGKTIFLGLDGIEPSIFYKLLDEGKLPNFSKIKSNGLYGNTITSIPNESLLCWTIMYTGKNSGKLGLLGYWKKNKNGYNYIYSEVNNIPSPDIFDYCLYYDKKIFSVGMIGTFPPKPVNGVLVCGPLSYDEKCFTFPADITPIILEEGYVIRASQYMSESEILNGITKRFELGKLLMNYGNWDIFMLGSEFTDTVGHYWWNKRPEFIEEVYMLCDKKLGEIIDICGEENNYIILSDHGMGPRKYRWNLGKWLIDEKFMFVKTDDERKKESDFTKNRLRKQFYDNLKKEDTGSLKKILKRCAFELWLLKQNIPVLNKMKIPFMKRPVGAHNENLIIPGTNSPIDYNKSLAFHHIPNLGRVAGIYLNFMPMNPAAPIKSVSEYENIRNTLIEKLKKVSDEKTGNPIIKNVWKREELYSGAYTNELFDIIIEFNEDYTDFEDSKDFYKMENIRTLAEPVIYHREKGIFFAAGHCFNGKNVAVRIHDVYSILSYLLDLPVYKNVDSKLDKSLFNDNFNATHKYEIIDNEPEKGRKEHLLSEDELNYVKKNLNKLGYLKKK